VGDRPKTQKNYFNMRELTIKITYQISSISKNDTVNISYDEKNNISTKRIDEIKTVDEFLLSVDLVALIVLAGVAIKDYFSSKFEDGFKPK
jgi:hypothetical protein